MRVNNIDTKKKKKKGRRGSVHPTENSFASPNDWRSRGFRSPLNPHASVHVCVATSQLGSESKEFPVTGRKVQFVFSEKALGKYSRHNANRTYSRQILCIDQDT